MQDQLPLPVVRLQHESALAEMMVAGHELNAEEWIQQGIEAEAPAAKGSGRLAMVGILEAESAARVWIPRTTRTVSSWVTSSPLRCALPVSSTANTQYTGPAAAYPNPPQALAHCCPR